MRCGLCGFLIIKPQTALHHAMWCDAMHCYLQYDAVMPFCGRFWCSFCSLCGLMNTTKYSTYLNTFINIYQIKIYPYKDALQANKMSYQSSFDND